MAHKLAEMAYPFCTTMLKKNVLALGGQLATCTPGIGRRAPTVHVKLHVHVHCTFIVQYLWYQAKVWDPRYATVPVHVGAPIRTGIDYYYAYFYRANQSAVALCYWGSACDAWHTASAGGTARGRADRGAPVLPDRGARYPA